MFDVSLGELAIIILVAVIFIGPKELPAVLRACARGLRHLRELTGELRRAFDDVAKESGLDEAERDIRREMRLIEGGDGRQYPTYDISDFLPANQSIKITHADAAKDEHESAT